MFIIDVSYQALRDHCGIKAVIFDKDNTLTAPYENSLHPRAKFGLQSALDIFGRDNVAILSNSAGTDDDPGFVDGKEIEEALGIAVIKHSEKKPGETTKSYVVPYTLITIHSLYFCSSIFAKKLWYIASTILLLLFASLLHQYLPSQL